MNDNVIPFPGGRRQPAAANPATTDRTGQAADRSTAAAADQIRAWATSHGLLGDARRTIASFRASSRPQPALLTPRPDRVAFVVRIDLDNAKPPIWRRLRLASDLNLERLHAILQDAMGWTNSHLHQFQMGPDARDFMMAPFLSAYDLEEGDEDGIPEAEVRLDQVIAKPGHRLFYWYDFGDSWHHTIKLESIESLPAEALCLAGRRACPPEDVGGLGGYEEIVAGLAGQIEPGEEEWIAERLEWLPPGFDLEAFDVDEVNELLAIGPYPELDAWRPQVVTLALRAALGSSEADALLRRALAVQSGLVTDVVAAATAAYRTLLEAVGDGVTLTAAGYLPPRLVAALLDRLDVDPAWADRGSREELARPVLTLRETATSLGLLRKARGTLTVTQAGRKAAANPSWLFAHVADRLPLGRESERDAGWLVLLYAATGRTWHDSYQVATRSFEALGWSHQYLPRVLFEEGRRTDTILGHLTGPSATPEWRAAVARALLLRP